MASVKEVKLAVCEYHRTHKELKPMILIEGFQIGRGRINPEPRFFVSKFFALPEYRF